MPTTITPSGDLNAAVSVPNSGEPRTALSVRTPMQALLNRLGALTDSALFTLHDSRRELSVRVGGTRNNFDIDVGPISAIMVHDGSGNDYVLSYQGGTISEVNVEGGGGDLGAVAKWWYVYAYRSGSNIAFEISDDAPNAGRTQKTGDNTRAYVGCFPTLSTGAPVPLRAVAGRYVYRVSGCASADLKVLAGLSDTSYTAVDCARLIPPHARLGSFRASLVSTTGTSQNFAYFQTYGDSGVDAVQLHVDAVVASSDDVLFDLETDASQRLQYQVSNLTSPPDAVLWVHGFYE